MTEPKTSQMEAGHTPLPWILDTASDRWPLIWDNKREFVLAKVDTSISGPVKSLPEARANAAFILRAVNSHNSLLSACEGALRDLRCISDDQCLYCSDRNGCRCANCECYAEIQSAIAAAGGGNHA